MPQFNRPCPDCNRKSLELGSEGLPACVNPECPGNASEE